MQDTVKEDNQLLAILRLFKNMVGGLKDMGVLETIHKTHMTIPNCNTYGYKFNINGKDYGSWTEIDLDTNVGRWFEVIFGGDEHE